MNTWTTRARLGACSVIAATGFCAGTPVLAGELEYRATFGAGHTDNVRRRPENRDSENIGIAGLQFSFDEQTRRLNADVVGDLAYFEYLNNSYDSELLGNVYGNALFSIVPERFVWVLSDQFGQVLTDPFLPTTAENRENLNYATTGPDFYLGLGAQTRLRLSGRYALTTYESEPLDSTTTSGELGLIRVLSDRSAVSLNTRMQTIEYDEQALNADFDQREYYLRYEAEGARTNLSVDAGYGELDRKAATEVEGGALVQINGSRRLSESSLVTLSAGRRFATSASSFANDSGINNVGLSTAPGRQTPDPFTRDEVTASWTYARNRTGINLSGNWTQRSYDDNPNLDQSLLTIAGRYTRDLSPMKTLEFTAAYTGVQFQPPAADYNDLTAGVSFSWRLTRNVTVEAKYEFYDRNSDAAAVNTTENRLLLTIGWGHGEPRMTRAAPRFGVDPPPPAPEN